MNKPLKTLSAAVAMTGLPLPSPSPASTTEITQAAGFWTQAVAEGNLSSIDENLWHVRLWVEGQARFNNANPMSNMNWYQGMRKPPALQTPPLPILLWPLMLAALNGCAIQAHDAELDRYRLEENLKPAEVLAKKLAVQDLDCAKIAVREMSAKITGGDSNCLNH